MKVSARRVSLEDELMTNILTGLLVFGGRIKCRRLT